MKKQMKLSTILMTIVLLSLVSCAQRRGADIQYDVPDKIDINYEVLDSIDISQAQYGVVPLPEELGKTLNGLFVKYTKHLAPNGKPIHIFAQANVTDLQLQRAREILKFHLADVPGSKYGSDKTAIANRMGDVRATLMYTDTEAHSFAMRPILRKSKLRLQDLYATESPVEGDYEYVHNEGKPGERFTRDASYEEIMHLVHAKGIDDEAPEFAEAIAKAEKEATDAGIYRYGRTSPHEYIITGFDLYYGLWDHNPQGDGKSFGDEYEYHTRAEMKEGDRALYDLVEGFWPEYLSYDAYIDPSFEGIFTMVQDENIEYTFKSRHLLNVLLTGSSNSGILGNDQDNKLSGNEGDNLITGGGGNDMINGGEGNDTAGFSGPRSEYEIEEGDEKTIVKDTVEGRDGTDVLVSVESLKFLDE